MGLVPLRPWLLLRSSGPNRPFRDGLTIKRAECLRSLAELLGVRYMQEYCGQYSGRICLLQRCHPEYNFATTLRNLGHGWIP